MAKKIGISLHEDLYEWAAREVREGRAESVSALVAEGLSALRGYAELARLRDDLADEAGHADEQTMIRVRTAEQAASAAHQRHVARANPDGHAA